MNHHSVDSMETILTFHNRDDDLSDWSVVWSTGQVPGMDTATGGGASRRRQAAGRRRLRVGTLALGSLLTMHVRVTSTVFTGGYFVYMLLLMLAMAVLANPLRHFEVYLGQWSISGPGRAFRFIPMFDGIGIAVAIGSLVRAIVNCGIAAWAAIYLMHALSDGDLPSTLCRDFDLNTYRPSLEDEAELLSRRHGMSSLSEHNERNRLLYLEQRAREFEAVSYDDRVNNFSKPDHLHEVALTFQELVMFSKHQIQLCKNPYAGQQYPLYCETAPYNFFYVEVANYRPNESFQGFDLTLAVMIAINWAIIWCCMIKEKISHGRLIWNNIPPWFLAVPGAWILIVFVTGLVGVSKEKYVMALAPKFHLGSDKMISAIGDALETAIYIHSASTGTELVHGKGLNHYASGHIDPALHDEGVWHSSILMILTAMSSAASVLCGLTDLSQINLVVNKTESSSAWILPMYSRCASFGNYTHLKSILIFSGLIFSYVAVSYVLVKTALHIIFEYRVKLVFVEQFLVGCLVLACTALSMVFATKGGLPLLESVDTLMGGLAMPFICMMELMGLLFVYEGRDFVSDMNVAMEENECSSRMEMQWNSLTFIVLLLLCLRISSMFECEMPTQSMWLGTVPLIAVAIAVPVRAAHNAFVFLKPTPRRGT